jgi:hypothetical protein
MFLENASEFSSYRIKNTQNFLRAVRSMERDLNLLRRESMELKLNEEYVWAEFVEWPLLENMIQAWRPIDEKLRELFTQLRRAAPDALENLRNPLVSVLQEVEETVRPLNSALISEMAEKLKRPPGNGK